MSDVNDLSLNLFYGSKPTPAPYPPASSHRYNSTHSSRPQKRPHSYPTPVPHLPSFDDKTNPSPPSPSSAPTSSSQPATASKKYIKPAPIYDLPTLKPRHHSQLDPDSLLPTASTLSDTSLFSTSAFSSFSLSPRLISSLTKLTPPVTHPTRIQSLAIPALLSSSDAILRSHTGSGKTLAYLLPLVHSLSLLSLTSPITRLTPPLALILSPTRELSLQTYSTLQTLLTAYHWIIPTLLMGGEQKSREKSRLRKGVHILVATPGRLLDHLDSTERLDVSEVRWLVLDEADRLLDLGFEKEVGDIVKRLEDRRSKVVKRQTVLVSATIDKAVRRLADVTLHNPALVGFDDEKAVESLPSTITHHVLQVESRHRLVALAAFLRRETMTSERQGHKSKIIVFFSTCSSVEFHHALFTSLFWPPPSPSSPSPPTTTDAAPLLTSPLYQLHGQMSQKDRSATYLSFHSSSSAILLCTDVAARGLDLPQVDWIVQYDVAEEVEGYVHRVGRCGRIGREGKGVIFLTEKEARYVTLLPESIAFRPLTLPPLLSSLRVSSFSASSPPAGAMLQRLIEGMVSGNRVLYQMAVKGYQSWVRAYAGYGKVIKGVMGGVGALHLGHVCRSFGLGEEPTRVGKMREGEVDNHKKEEKREETEREKKASEKTRVWKAEKEEKRGEGIVETVALFKKRKVDTMSEFAA